MKFLIAAFCLISCHLNQHHIFSIGAFDPTNNEFVISGAICFGHVILNSEEDTLSIIDIDLGKYAINIQAYIQKIINN